jgi:hypothetical protein
MAITLKGKIVSTSVSIRMIVREGSQKTKNSQSLPATASTANEIKVIARTRDLCQILIELNAAHNFVQDEQLREAETSTVIFGKHQDCQCSSLRKEFRRLTKR